MDTHAYDDPWQSGTVLADYFAFEGILEELKTRVKAKDLGEFADAFLATLFFRKILSITNTLIQYPPKALNFSRKKFGTNKLSTNSFTNYYISKTLKKFGMPFQPLVESGSFVTQKRDLVYFCPYETAASGFVFPCHNVGGLPSYIS